MALIGCAGQAASPHAKTARAGAIKKANIRKYSIYLKNIGDKLYLFSYFEYVGDNFDADMAAIARNPVTRRWWQQTDPCQLPLPDAEKKGEIWDGMEEVFHVEIEAVR